MWQIVIVGLAFFGMYSCSNSEWYAEDKRRDAEIVKRNATPHLYKESPDGCKVYRFKDNDQWQFYTRCPNANVSTQSAWSECVQQGKHQTCTTKTRNIDTVIE